MKNKCAKYTWIFPDTLGDNHTSRIYLSIILFGSYLLLFNQNTINEEAERFLKKYGIENIA